MRMTLRGYPFLMEAPTLYREVFGVSRHTFWARVKAGEYPRLKWLKDGKTLKAAKWSVEEQLIEMAEVGKKDIESLRNAEAA